MRIEAPAKATVHPAHVHAHDELQENGVFAVRLEPFQRPSAHSSPRRGDGRGTKRTHDRLYSHPPRRKLKSLTWLQKADLPARSSLHYYRFKEMM